MELNELIEKIKMEQHLTDDDIGKWMGITGNALGKRRRENNFNFRQLRRLITKAHLSNSEILGMFGRKEAKEDITEKEMLREIRKITKLIKESQYKEPQTTETET